MANSASPVCAFLLQNGVKREYLMKSPCHQWQDSAPSLENILLHSRISALVGILTYYRRNSFMLSRV